MRKGARCKSLRASCLAPSFVQGDNFRRTELVLQYDFDFVDFIMNNGMVNNYENV
jgi:hypothetical protein